MLTLIMASLMVAGNSAPVQAPVEPQVAHQASVVHEGRTVMVTYSPKVETSFRQTGKGPREPIRCFWQTSVSAQRTVVTDGGQPVAALSRVVQDGETIEGAPAALKSGMRGVHCAALPASDVAAFGGDRGHMQRYLAQVAAQDQSALHRELAGLGGLFRAD